MKKLFNRVVDINGKTCKYPVDQNSVVFCFTRDEKYCIYALYTKKDLTESSIIELTKDIYLEEVEKYKNTYGKEPTTLFLASMIAVEGVTTFAKYKATVDNTTIGELLRFDEGENI